MSSPGSERQKKNQHCGMVLFLRCLYFFLHLYHFPILLSNHFDPVKAVYPGCLVNIFCVEGTLVLDRLGCLTVLHAVMYLSMVSAFIETLLCM